MAGAYRKVLFVMGMVMAGIAHAEPYVIANVGHSELIDEYTSRIDGVVVTNIQRLHLPGVTRPTVSAAQVVAAQFPIRTAVMQPGRLQPRRATIQGLKQPLCVIGSDALSRQWLARYRSILKKAGATCVIAEASSPAVVKDIRELGAGVPMVPADASSIAQTVHVYRYPVLIGPQYIEQ